MASRMAGGLSMKNWVKITYNGPGDPPNRDFVADLIFQSQWLQVQDIHSFISLPSRKDFELCFRTERALRIFLDVHSQNERLWKDFELFSPVKSDEKTIIVKFWTGRISDEDIETYLRRFCEILKPVVKPVDKYGLWYGIRKYQVKMKKDTQGNETSLPNSISLGPHNGKITYHGQVSRCFICQDLNHQAKECGKIKCWQCGSFGHKGKQCTFTANCTLCGAKGHNYFMCPKSYANISRVVSRPSPEPEPVEVVSESMEQEVNSSTVSDARIVRPTTRFTLNHPPNTVHRVLTEDPEASGVSCIQQEGAENEEESHGEESRSGSSSSDSGSSGSSGDTDREDHDTSASSEGESSDESEEAKSADMKEDQAPLSPSSAPSPVSRPAPALSITGTPKKRKIKTTAGGKKSNEQNVKKKKK